MVMGETIHAERGRNFALGALEFLRYTPTMLFPSLAQSPDLPLHADFQTTNWYAGMTPKMSFVEVV